MIHKIKKVIAEILGQVSPHTLPSISTYFAKYLHILCQVCPHTLPSISTFCLSVADSSGRVIASIWVQPTTAAMNVFIQSSQKKSGKQSARRTTRVTTPSGNRTEGRVGNYPALIPAAFVLWIKSRVPNCSNFVGKVEVNRV